MTLAFGVDYYPEQWPESRLELDACLMAEAGFNTVRLAEFAWSKMEPSPGQYDFDWLDRAITVLSARGMKIVLGTPSAGPPPWLIQRYPEALRVLENGQRQVYGHRRYNCPNHPAYREYARRIAEKMADHYATHPAVIGWQVDNEFGTGDRCCCPICASRFQDWLRNCYGDLPTLNKLWGTTFWSHEYNEWSQIPAPIKTAGSHNPGLALDFARFSSDSYVDFQCEQVEILRSRCSTHFITHNMMGFGFEQLNYFDLARDLDFVGWDCYTRTQWDVDRLVNTHDMPLSHAAMRGLKGKNFWVLEQQSGPGGWEIIPKPVRPGEIRLWAYQSIAHGADGVLFFRWRTARFGTEQYWHGILDHHGNPGRRYNEIKSMGQELKLIGGQVAGSEMHAEVAILQDYDSRFAFQIQPNHPAFSYVGHLADIFRAFHANNIPVDVVAPDAPLTSYRLVFAPALHVLTPEAAQNLAAYVAEGGILVVTPRSGVKDAANSVVNMPLPGLLHELCGVSVSEYVALYQASQPLQPARPDFPDSLVARTWCDILQPQTAEVLAVYTADFFARQAAVTLNNFQNGKVLTLGTFGDANFFTSLQPWLCQLANIQPILHTPAGVEAIQRGNLLFIINHTMQPQTFELDTSYCNLLTTRTIQELEIPSFDVAILKKER